LFLVRVSARDPDLAHAPESSQRLIEVLERIPDAFVVTDETLKIIAENSAFLDITRLASKEQARGQSLELFLGRPDMDRNILISNLRQYGSVKNFATVLRNQLDELEDVDVSAVFVAEGTRPVFGFSIRRSVRASSSRPIIASGLPRSAEQLSQLIGRVPLKELVRETTDLVERMCIEAALELTGNNRASAAEMLGLSRQSLYSKLHRYGLGAFPADGDGE
jgi:transcriptional regulator PpsR